MAIGVAISTPLDNSSFCSYDVITAICKYMAISIEGRVTKIGNSQGIRIPKILLEQSGILEHVNIEVRDCQIIITAATRSRVGWAEAFAQMAKNQDDKLLDEITATAWDGKEWEW